VNSITWSVDEAGSPYKHNHGECVYKVNNYCVNRNTVWLTSPTLGRLYKMAWFLQYSFMRRPYWKASKVSGDWMSWLLGIAGKGL